MERESTEGGRTDFIVNKRASGYTTTSTLGPQGLSPNRRYLAVWIASNGRTDELDFEPRELTLGVVIWGQGVTSLASFRGKSGNEFGCAG